MVDDFLRDQNLGTRDFAAVPAPTALAQPPQLGEKGRAGFSDDLSANPHNAFFSVSPGGAFAYRGGRRSAREAADVALAACANFAPDCTLYAVDGKLADKTGAASR